MKKIFTLSVLLTVAFALQSFAQSVGYSAVTYTDASRSNRSVTTEIYYPATSAGSNTPIASGQFPVIVFGHGFMMTYSAYAYFYNAMAALGYIVVLPTTESGMSPVHANFGADEAFLITQMKSEGTNSSSFFYNHIAVTSAIMGHSMGGGAAFLACENNTTPTCMVTFAEAETTPSSMAAARSVTIPALVLSGSVDCVAPPATNQVPTYDSLASACKVFISITGGCHCYFADYNLYCIIGEQTCDTNPPLATADQEDATLDFVKLYLDYYLKNNAASWTAFNDSLQVSHRITYQTTCPLTGLTENKPKSKLQIWPNPADKLVNVQFGSTGNYQIRIFDAVGKQSFIEQSGYANSAEETETIDISSLKNGFYFIEVNNNGVRSFNKIIKE